MMTKEEAVAIQLKELICRLARDPGALRQKLINQIGLSTQEQETLHNALLNLK